MLEEAEIVKKLRKNSGTKMHVFVEMLLYIFYLLMLFLIFAFFTGLAVKSFGEGTIEKLPVLAQSAINFIPLGLLPVWTLLFARIIQKRRIFAMDCTDDPAGAEYWRGAGAALFGVISIFLFARVIKVFDPFQFNVGINFLMILLWFGICLLQGTMEEILFRGGLFMTLVQKYSVMLAAVISALVFSLVHIGMEGYNLLSGVTLFLFGLFSSLIMVRRGNILTCCAFHSFWMFGRTILFHLDTQTIDANSYVFAVHASNKTWLSGGSFGLDGSVFALGMLLIMLCFELVYWRNLELDQAEPGKVQEGGQELDSLANEK